MTVMKCVTRLFIVGFIICSITTIFLMIKIEIFNLDTYGNSNVGSLITVEIINTTISNYPFQIDVVYLWANSSDKNYTFAKQNTIKLVKNNPEANIFIETLNITIKTYGGRGKHSFCPTFDHGELRLSLRSLFKYNTGWLGNIYIITTFKQQPIWLNFNHSMAKNIQIIDANELLSKCAAKYTNNNVINIDIATFNSHAIYLCLHLIDNLSTIFMQSDDDFIFFDKFPFNLVYNQNTGFGQNYLHNVERRDLAALPTQQKIMNHLFAQYNKPQISVFWAAHRARIWNITKINEIWSLYPLECLNTIFHPFRSLTDIDLTSFYPLYQYAKYDVDIQWYEHEAYLSLRKKGTMQQYMHEINDILNRNHIWLKSMVLQDGIHYDLGYIPNGAAKFTFILPAILQLNPLPFEHCKPFSTNTAVTAPINIMGHRGIGYSQDLVENTLQNFQFAVKNGVYWIECDIALTMDDVVIIHHTEQYLYQGCKRNNILHEDIAQLTYNELRTDQKYGYVIGNNTYFISSLMEVLLWAKEYVIEEKEKIYFQVELKQYTKHEYMNDCIANPKLSKCYQRSIEDDALINNLIKVIDSSDYLSVCSECLIISSFEAPRLNNVFHKMKGLNNVWIGLALIIGPRSIPFKSDEVNTLINCAKYWNLTDISVFSKSATSELIEKCRNNGIKIQIGMPGGSACLQEISDKPHPGDSFEALLDAIILNPHVICTNQPVMAHNILQMSYKCPIHHFHFNASMGHNKAIKINRKLKNKIYE